MSITFSQKNFGINEVWVDTFEIFISLLELDNDSESI